MHKKMDLRRQDKPVEPDGSAVVVAAAAEAVAATDSAFPRFLNMV